MHPDLVVALDGILAEGVSPESATLGPGAVLVVSRRGSLAYAGAHGWAQTHSEGIPLERPRPMTKDTIFDIASLTKVCATTIAAMHLVAAGGLDLDAEVGRFFPGRRDEGATQATIRHLLTHRAGLWEWWPVYIEARDRVAALEAILDLPLRYPLDSARHYSDLGMMLVGAAIESVAGEPLDAFAERVVFAPLGLRDTGFLPGPEARLRTAATSTADDYEKQMLASGEPYPVGRRPEEFDGWRSGTLVGEVEDGNAHHAFGGIAGHAGLFSTASEVERIGRLLLQRGRWEERQVIPAAVVDDFSTPGKDPEQGVGVWTNLRAGLGLGRGGFGHGGFTGTRLFVEPETDLVVVLMTNRTHHPLPYPDIDPVWRTVIAATSSALE